MCMQRMTRRVGIINIARIQSIIDWHSRHDTSYDWLNKHHKHNRPSMRNMQNMHTMQKWQNSKNMAYSLLYSEIRCN